MASKLNLDKLDLQIIQHMIENAEISYADLGKKLFVSGGTIHVRIKKLQEIGIVKGTRLNVDLKQLGYDVIAFIGIYLEKSSLYDVVAKELQKIPEISVFLKNILLFCFFEIYIYTKNVLHTGTEKRKNNFVWD